MSETFDLSQLDTIKASEISTKVTIVNPVTKEDYVINGEPVWVSVLGPDSKTYKETNNKIVNSRINTNKRGGKVTAELIDQENRKLVASVITGWSSAITRNGDEFPFNSENALILITAYPVIYDQLNEFLGDRGNFLEA